MDYISLIKCDNSFTGLKKEQVLKNQKNMRVAKNSESKVYSTFYKLHYWIYKR